ncbi:MAG: caspase family protein [Leptospiraceae bacterium]|nr:caspase family protein [Leptospiraceae bacterium]
MNFQSKHYFIFNSIVLITLLFFLPVYSQEKKVKPTKTYHIKSKGMKLTEIDEEGVPINNGKRYAIIIGINDYNDTAISDLSKARNDAKGIGKILKDIGQFDQVFVMTDDVVRSDPEHLYPTKLNIEEKIESVLRFTTPDDLIVFYFSGHGISDYDENGFLVTADTVADKKFDTSLRVDWIVKKFKEKKIKKSLLVLDACRDKLYTSKSSERDSIKEKIYTEAEVAATFYSTKSGYYSYEDDDSDYGVFTKNLIYGMEGRADDNNDGVVSFGELQQFVEKGVRDWSIKKNKQ